MTSHLWWWHAVRLDYNHAKLSQSLEQAVLVKLNRALELGPQYRTSRYLQECLKLKGLNMDIEMRIVVIFSFWGCLVILEKRDFGWLALNDQCIDCSFHARSVAITFRVWFLYWLVNGLPKPIHGRQVAAVATRWDTFLVTEKLDGATSQRYTP